MDEAIRSSFRCYIANVRHLAILLREFLGMVMDRTQDLSALEDVTELENYIRRLEGCEHCENLWWIRPAPSAIKEEEAAVNGDMSEQLYPAGGMEYRDTVSDLARRAESDASSDSALDLHLDKDSTYDSSSESENEEQFDRQSSIDWSWAAKTLKSLTIRG